MPDPGPTAQLIDAHDRTRQNILTALTALGEVHDSGEATANLAITLGDTARRYRTRTANEAAAAESMVSELLVIRQQLTDALTLIGEPHDNIDTTGQVAAVTATALAHWHLRATRAERERDTVALRLSGKSRTLPISAGTYHHDSRDYAIIVDRQGRTLAVDATRTDGHIEISGSDIVLDGPAALRAAADTLNAIANHIDERPTA